MAEPHATWKFEGDGYRNFGRCFLSTVGFGTYLGEADDETDAGYSESLKRAFELGCNVVDTAINYRHQRSERVVGEVLDGGSVNDDEVFVSTKGGYIPFRLDVPDDPKRFITEEYIEPGLVSPEDVVDANCINPEFLKNQIGRSLENLRRDSVDLYYVHNPETHLKVMEPEEFESLLTDVFVMLERKVGDSIGSYGVATWDGLRAREEETKHISLESLVETAEEAAEEVGNDENSFDAVQMPYNANMTEAYTRKNQRVRGEEMSALEAAE
ncbi:MAG: aldo/keto reductase, partial [Halobacteria archaeon]|nr:aldo/keto reductase [Halobacteria archaeon]